MGASKKYFSSMKHSKVPHIFIGDDTKVEVEEKGEVDMENEAFNDVLYVPILTSKLLLVYQITHYGGGNKVEFLLDLVIVKNVNDDSMVAIGEANHDSRLYTFSSFVPKSNAQALLMPSNIEIKLWHKSFGHLNYKYLHQFSNKKMVHGIPQV